MLRTWSGVVHGSSHPPALPRTTPHRTRSGGRLPLLVGLVVSGVVHASILFSTIELGWAPDGRSALAGTPWSAAGALRAVNLEDPVLGPVRQDLASPTSAPPIEPAPDTPASHPTAGGHAPDVPRDRPFRIQPGDPRLWRPAPPTSAVLEAVGSARLRLQLLADSVNHRWDGIRSPPGGDVTAWTPAGASDAEWGISPGAVHLGGLTIPLCSGAFDPSSCGFGVRPHGRDTYKHRLRAVLELARQGAHAEIMERARAIRARKDSLPATRLRDGS